MIGAALRHALGHGAASQRDGGDGLGDHRDKSVARTKYTRQRITYSSGNRRRSDLALAARWRYEAST